MGKRIEKMRKGIDTLEEALADTDNAIVNADAVLTRRRDVGTRGTRHRDRQADPAEGRIGPDAGRDWDRSGRGDPPIAYGQGGRAGEVLEQPEASAPATMRDVARDAGTPMWATSLTPPTPSKVSE